MSIDMTDFIITIERTFNIVISDDDHERLDTVGALVGYIAEKTNPADDDEILEKVKRFVADFFRVDPKDVKMETRWEYLGAG